MHMQPNDYWGPWCTIRSVTRCDEYLDESICNQRFWNFRAEIQDTYSGKRIFVETSLS